MFEQSVLKQLVAEYSLAHVQRMHLEDVAERTHRDDVELALREALAAEDTCRHELQKALWIYTGGEA